MFNKEQWNATTYQTTKKVRRWCKKYYREVQELSRNAYKRYYTHPWVETVHTLLKSKKPKKYIRPTHQLFCECRNCEPSINTYYKRIMSIK